MGILSIALVAVVLHTNVVVRTAAVAGDVSTRPAGMQCRLPYTPIYCANYNILESPSLNPFVPAEEMDKRCPNILKAVDCVQSLTPGCRGHSRLIVFNSQKEMAYLMCGSRRRDFIKAAKCYSVEGIKDEIEQQCIIPEIRQSNSCSLVNGIGDCVESVLSKHIDCTTENVELLNTLLKIQLKPEIDPNCHQSKGDTACTKKTCKNGGVCYNDYVNITMPCDCSLSGWSGTRCDTHPLGYYFGSQGNSDSTSMMKSFLSGMKRTREQDEIVFGIMTEDENAILVIVTSAFNNVKMQIRLVEGYVHVLRNVNVSLWTYWRHDLVYVSDGSYHIVRYVVTSSRVTVTVDGNSVNVYLPEPLTMIGDENQVSVGGDFELERINPGTGFEGIIGGLNVNGQLVFYQALDNVNTTFYGDVRVAPIPYKLFPAQHTTEKSTENATTDPPAPTRSCADIMNCQPDMALLQAAQNRQDFASICEIVQSSGQCMKESLTDCRRAGAIPEEQIKLIESQMAAGLRQLEEYCSDHSSSNTEPPVDTQTKDLYPRPTMATHEVSTATKGQSSQENDGRGTGTTETSTRAIKRKDFVEEKSSSLNPELYASSLVNPFLAWLNSGSKLNKAQEKLAVEQKFVAKLMRKKLKLDISLLKKKLNGKKE